MKGYGHLWQPALPLIAIGLGNCLVNLRSSRHRMIMIALLAAPAGAAIAQLGITRALFMVFPAALLATLGASTLWRWLLGRKGFQRWKNSTGRLVLAMTLFSTISAASMAMLVDALQHGPTWFRDYGLYGMQFGAKEVFSQIKTDLAENPRKRLVLTPAWANGTDILARYFFSDPLPFELASIDSYLREYRPLDENTIIIMMPNEREDMLASGKFGKTSIDKIIPYPDGSPGFYFLQVSYVNGIQEVFAEEQESRRSLVSADLYLQDGTPAAVHYSTLDMGSINDLFDGDPLSVARTWESNPFVLVFDFPHPRLANQLVLRVGGEPTRIVMDLYTDMNSVPLQMGVSVPENPHPRDIMLDLNLTQPLIKAVVRVYNENEQEPTHVHLWEIRFLPDLE